MFTISCLVQMMTVTAVDCKHVCRSVIRRRSRRLLAQDKAYVYHTLALFHTAQHYSISPLLVLLCYLQLLL